MSTQSVRDIVLASLLALVLLVIVLGPMLLRLARRVRRHRAIVAGDELAAWNEVRDTALDLGIPVLETESARALATSLASRAGEDAEAPLARILSAVEQGAYARSQHGDVAVDDVTAVRRALLRSAGVRERIRAVVLPRSLLRRH
jgi:hypothetical protein